MKLLMEIMANSPQKELFQKRRILVVDWSVPSPDGSNLTGIDLHDEVFKRCYTGEEMLTRMIKSGVFRRTRMNGNGAKFN